MDKAWSQTTDFRWLEVEHPNWSPRITLQQRIVELKTGESKWVDVPTIIEEEDKEG